MIKKRTLGLLAVLAPLFGLFIYVALHSGPLAPVSVVLATVQSKSISPALFGIGTVESRYTYHIGPTFNGRLKTLNVHVGEQVKTGQVLGKMDPVDIDARILAQISALKRAQAKLAETVANEKYSQTQAFRYVQLFKKGATSKNLMELKQRDFLIAQAKVTAAQEEIAQIQAEIQALKAQRKNLFLISPVDGLVVSRNFEPGSTVVAGQTILEIIKPDYLWINTRFDQIHSQGLKPGLPATIVLRSHKNKKLQGHILRIEPLADAITEETLAKIVFKQTPNPLPPVGELAEVTITLPSLTPAPIIPNAAIHYKNGQIGVWKVIKNKLYFTPVVLGKSDLKGQVQVLKGLKVGDNIVVYSENPLKKYSKINIVEHIPGVE
ncbi:MAG: efflux RND transporter periplasmic adaptor subunit [Desulfonauticus sp.]|nr:efflux RND transporter periplasmic adaptor subunit [Desulfonauticus sp.]